MFISSMSKINSKHLFSLFILFFFSGCAPSLQVRDAGVVVPPAFKNQTSLSEKTIPLKYWELFNEPLLNRWIEEGLKNNANLKAASYRIEKDYAQARLKLSDNFPQVFAGGSYARNQASLNTGQPIGQFGIPREQNLFSLGLDFSYEIDLWGRVRNLYRAARANAKATYLQGIETRQTLVSEICKHYFALQYNRGRVQLRQSILEQRQKQLQLAESVFKAGLIPEQDLLQAKISEKLAEDLLKTTQTQQAVLKTSLAVLLGESPSLFEEEPALPHEKFETIELPRVIPSEWIRKRPDILAAEQRLLASNAMTKSALADFFPKFTFEAKLGVQSQNASHLLSQASQFFGLGPSVSLPILNLGKTISNYQSAKSQAQVSLEEYRNTVLSAFKEIEDRFAEFFESKQTYENGRMIYDSRNKLTQLSTSKSKAGLTGGSTLAESQIAENLAKIDLGDARLSLLVKTIDLMKAFGENLKEVKISSEGK